VLVRRVVAVVIGLIIACVGVASCGEIAEYLVYPQNLRGSALALLFVAAVALLGGGVVGGIFVAIKIGWPKIFRELF
jgi:hypothetical protein